MTDRDPLNELEALPHFACPFCGEENDCAAARAGRLDVACWCATVTIDPGALSRAQAAGSNACLCRRCGTSGQPAEPAVEPAQPEASMVHHPRAAM